MEEMTLLSRIFRNVQVNDNSEKTRAIQIKSLQLREEIDIDQTLSLDVILKERDQLLHEAEEQIALTKETLAQEIEQTKQYVDEQLKTWEEQKIAYQQTAYDEGFVQGLEEGRNKAIADMQQSLSIANETIQVAHENATNYLQHQEQVILELAIRTAERIIGTKLEEEEELFLSVVKRGLKRS